MRGELRVVSGKYAGRAVIVGPGEKVVVGRASSSGLQLNSVGVSRRHAEFLGGKDGVGVSDLGSRNGVRVNGDRISGRHALVDGDQVEIGRNLLVFVQIPPDPEPVESRQPSTAPDTSSPTPDEPVPAVQQKHEADDGIGAPVAKSVSAMGPTRVKPPEPSGPFGMAEPAHRPNQQPTAEGPQPPAPDPNDLTSEVPSLGDQPPEDPLVAAVMARKVGHFILEKKLGRGGVGVVFRAKDTKRDTRVALKVLKTEKAQKAYHAERFRQECAVLSVLDHPGVVRCVDHGRVGELLYLAMEYAEGDTLETVRKARGQVPVGEAMDWTIQILKAVGYCHEKNVIHRDLKPANVILGPDGQTKLVDFGLGRMTEATTDSGRLTIDSMAMGTRHFMPPEQIRDTASVDHRADLYAVAAMLFLFVSGELAFPKEGGMMAEVKAILESEPRSLGEFCDAPLSLEKLITRGLAKDPADRFQSATEMQQALELVWR